jgi:hypothetical protein
MIITSTPGQHFVSISAKLYTVRWQDFKIPPSLVKLTTQPAVEKFPGDVEDPSKDFDEGHQTHASEEAQNSA